MKYFYYSIFAELNGFAREKDFKNINLSPILSVDSLEKYIRYSEIILTRARACVCGKNTEFFRPLL